jgi:RNA polymerase sigma-70 factor (ECF subfamily)
LVPLAEQDRSLWDHDLIHEGQDLVRRCLRRNLPGPYQVQAAIQAVHCDSVDAGGTDWNQILALYDQLLLLSPTPIVALNRAVVVGEVDGPAAALAIVDGLPLDRYPRHQAVRAEFLRRLDRPEDAAAAYRSAIAGTTNTVELAFLEERLRALTARTTS